MLEQYLRFKEENPGCLLFFRMGDFYELFFEDAEIVARAVQIALTSRNPKDDNPIPMCGMPHHSVEPYLSQLLDKGYKIAICDQIEDPREAKGLVKRDVTRVLTPALWWRIPTSNPRLTIISVHFIGILERIWVG